MFSQNKKKGIHAISFGLGMFVAAVFSFKFALVIAAIALILLGISQLKR